MSPHIHLRSLPPKGASASFEAARQEAKTCPHIHVRSLPPKGASASFEAARLEAV